MEKDSLSKNIDTSIKSDALDGMHQNLLYLMSIIKTLPGYVYWKNIQGIYMGCNESMLTLANVEELIGKSDFDLSWKNEAPKIKKNDLLVVKSGVSIDQKEILTLSNGKECILLIKKTPLKDSQERIIGILGIATDITNQIYSEDKIDFDIANVIEHLPGHVYLKDKNFVYRYCNIAQAKSAGFSSPEGVIGKTDYEMPWSHEANKLRQSDLQVINSRKILTNEEESKLAHSKEVKIFLSKKVPLFDSSGNVVGILGISFDISDRKKMEAKLNQEKEAAEIALENIIANMPGHVYWKDKNGVYLGCNNRQAESLGLKFGSEIVGKTDFELPWAKNIAQRFRENDIRIMQTGKIEIIEEQAQVNGQEIIVLSQKTPLWNNQNEVVGILGISFDITDRKKLEMDLIEAKEKAEIASLAKTEFVANMSHDIRTPLTGIIGMSEALEAGASTSYERQNARWLHESGEQLLELCNGILDVISADNITELDLEEEPLDLRSTIEAIGKLELPTIKLKGLEFKLNIDEDTPQYVISDRVKLHRILLNLLGNAIKFTKEGYVGIDVKVLKKNKKNVELEFRVVDTGIGINIESQEKVFDQFFRADPSYNGIYRGHGIGLHIAQKYVALLGGNIQLTSEIGKGTCFYFTLALKIDENKLFKQPINPPSFEDSLNFVVPSSELNSSKKEIALDNKIPPLILLVEDSTIALRTLERLVESSASKFMSASDGEQAYTLATTHSFDLIITDIGLPDFSGIELTSKIRNWEKLQHKKPVPIVGLTGHAVQQAEPECLGVGMNKVLCKPANAHAIQMLIKEFVNIQQNVEKKSDQNNTPNSSLGADLPDSEEALFKIDHYPLFDIAVGVAIFGRDCEAIMKELLNDMAQMIPQDILTIQRAYEEGNWPRVEDLAHRIKGGAASCGTVRMSYASQYLERYCKAGYSTLKVPLYYQLIRVMNDSKTFIDEWLAKQI